jgi:hypothetical protein
MRDFTIIGISAVAGTLAGAFAAYMVLPSTIFGKKCTIADIAPSYIIYEKGHSVIVSFKSKERCEQIAQMLSSYISTPLKKYITSCNSCMFISGDTKTLIIMDGDGNDITEIKYSVNGCNLIITKSNNYLKKYDIDFLNLVQNAIAAASAKIN